MSARPLAPSRPSLLERVLRHVPGQCLVCGAWATLGLCRACGARFVSTPPRCWSCALRLPPGSHQGADAPPLRCAACLRQPPPLDRTIAALDYAFPWSSLLQRYKYQQALELRPLLLARLDAALERADAEAPDWLLPVPLSPQRLAERGYNQSLELARALARRRRLRCDAGLLLRLRDGPHQAGATLPARRHNVRRAFAVEPTRQRALRGAHVALLDDVMTTGATLFELARVLRRAGAASVQAWVLARTPADFDD